MALVRIWQELDNQETSDLAVLVDPNHQFTVPQVPPVIRRPRSHGHIRRDMPLFVHQPVSPGVVPEQLHVIGLPRNPNPDGQPYQATIISTSKKEGPRRKAVRMPDPTP